jgi:membrane protease YdiL (CAAX protease family)
LSNPLPLLATDFISLALIATSVGVFSRVILRLKREGGGVRSSGFQFSEALVALVLGGFFIWLMTRALSRREAAESALTVEQVLPSSVFFIILAGGIAAYLKFLRGMRLRETFGFNRVPPLKVLGWAAGLLVCVFPLVYMAAYFSQAALPKQDVTPQPLVELFRDVAHHGNVRAMVMILIDGIIIAPMCEEFLFRGFFYGVGKRFLGPIVAGFVSSALFAAFHLNLGSLASLFVLAICLNLAYERTGSLFVPMCMHALFNSANLFFIFGQAQGWFPSK